MKAIRKSVLATVALISTLTLGACSSDVDGIGLQVENGDELFITTDLINVTKQEAFEEMATSIDSNTRFNNGILALLDLVDADLLVGNFEINPDDIEDTMNNLRQVAGDDFEEYLLSMGFESEEAVIAYLELQNSRTAAARDAIVVTDEEVEEAYNLIFGLDTEDEDADVEENDTDTEEDEDANVEENDTDAEEDEDTDVEEDEAEEIPTLEEIQDDLREDLIQAQLTNAFIQTELARLRQEAGFVILDSYLQDQYIAFLEANGVNVEEVFSQTSETSKSIVAELGEIEYTAEQLFDALLPTVGLTSGFSLVDSTILGEAFEVPEDEVTELMNSIKVDWGDQFFPNMAQMGLNSSEEIFDYLEFILLQEVAFDEFYAPNEDRLKELYEEYEPNVSVRHILVDEEEQAKELIAQLQAADDIEELFAELAEEYSNCPSASNGGDLGSFGRGVMVPAFENAAFDLEVGELTAEPVETNHGFHVIYKYAVDEMPEFDEIRDELEEQELTNLRTHERWNSVFIRLREDVNFTFTNETLQARYETIAANILDSLEDTDSE